MLLGKIQSDKTKTFMAIMGLVFDNDYDVIVVRTKGTKANRSVEKLNSN
ncbi:hypothetical protein [Thorsellia anophelis]|nr:hypothetical protein [Thorsellia anophelis]